MSDEGGTRGIEKTRICPSCRMTISVFATKCRYCGEEPGRAKDEVRKLSTLDLGGETIQHEVPSESVTGAFEMYRIQQENERAEAEELSKPKSGLWKRKKGRQEEPAGKTRSDGLPELDEMHQELAGLSSLDSAIIRQAPKRVETHWKDRMLRASIAVVGLVILLFGGIKGGRWAHTYLENLNKPPEVHFTNRAPAILERGGSAISALEAAAEALRHVDSGENIRIAEDVLRKLAVEVKALLNADPWDIMKIAEASALATRAALVYPNDASRRLKRSVEDENTAYRMLLTGVDETSGGAIFKLNRPGSAKITVKKGDTIGGRFIVKSFSGRTVRVEDTRRKTKVGLNRIITYEVGNPVPR